MRAFALCVEHELTKYTVKSGTCTVRYGTIQYDMVRYCVDRIPYKVRQPYRTVSYCSHLVETGTWSRHPVQYGTLLASALTARCEIVKSHKLKLQYRTISLTRSYPYRTSWSCAAKHRIKPDSRYLFLFSGTRVEREKERPEPLGKGEKDRNIINR